jgi:MYXO-CTERM domain-containing protein
MKNVKRKSAIAGAACTIALLGVPAAAVTANAAPGSGQHQNDQGGNPHTYPVPTGAVGAVGAAGVGVAALGGALLIRRRRVMD